MVALCAVVPLAALGQSDAIKIVIAEQSSKGLTDARWTIKLLKLQEESAVNSAINDGKKAFMEAGGVSSDWKPRVRHDSIFLTVHGRKFGVVKAALTMQFSGTQTKFTMAFTAVRIMAIKSGKTWSQSVACGALTDPYRLLMAPALRQLEIHSE